MSALDTTMPKSIQRLKRRRLIFAARSSTPSSHVFLRVSKSEGSSISRFQLHTGPKVLWPWKRQNCTEIPVMTDQTTQRGFCKASDAVATVDTRHEFTQGFCLAADADAQRVLRLVIAIMALVAQAEREASLSPRGRPCRCLSPSWAGERRLLWIRLTAPPQRSANASCQRLPFGSVQSTAAATPPVHPASRRPSTRLSGVQTAPTSGSCSTASFKRSTSPGDGRCTDMRCTLTEAWQVAAQARGRVTPSTMLIPKSVDPAGAFDDAVVRRFVMTPGSSR